jgi:hypothetical protein
MLALRVTFELLGQLSPPYGRLWRLVHRDTAHKLDRYYEVDLPVLLERDEPDAFLYFYAFFRRAAFDGSADRLARALTLDKFLSESADYARSVGEGLKSQVFDALRHLAQGFLDYSANSLTTSETDFKAVYDHGLIVLYHLLFVFYAEARDLLPVSESRQYRDSYSLRSITQEVKRRLETGALLLPDTAKLWPQLRELFGLINKGSPPLEIATFNGGLFDPARYPFLKRYMVGGAHLQAALDGLARIKSQFINDRDLSERRQARQGTPRARTCHPHRSRPHHRHPRAQRPPALRRTDHARGQARRVPLPAHPHPRARLHLRVPHPGGRVRVAQYEGPARRLPHRRPDRHG